MSLSASALDPERQARQRRSRRRFLQFLAASPLFAAMPEAMRSAAAGDNAPFLISDPKEALNVMDFEPVARKNIPPAHFGYMATGVDDDATLRANREGFKKFQLRPRRLVNVSKIDMRVDLFGNTWDAPIFICPCGSQKAFHPEGEVATARAAKARHTLQILSTQTTSPIEDVAQAAGGTIWYQLYPTSRWEVTEKLVRRAEAAGCPVIAFTVDNLVGRHVETQPIMTRADTRQCSNCHADNRTATGGGLRGPGGAYARKNMFDGLDMQGVMLNDPSLTWDFVRKLKAATKMKLVLKGIETREDAALCRENGVDGIIVSNHGGRAEESGRGTIECLSEVLDGAGPGITVMIDSGFRRGTDVFKALAMGARAVGIGRPYLWGLGAFGQPGVERVLDLLRAELQLIMRQCGTPTLADISKAYVIRA